MDEENEKITETEIWAHISKNADKETVKKVTSWMKSDHYDPDLYREIRYIYENTNKGPFASLDMENARLRLFRAIKAKENKHRFWKNYSRYAVILLFTIATSVYYMSLKDKVTITTAYGEQKQIDLSDGSQVWLNASSNLSYNVNSPRTLYLEGEALFEVAKDKDVPFTVETHDHIKVRALGTRFNVKSYEGNPYTETVLLNGEVEVTSDRSNEKFKMLPSDRVRFLRDENRFIRSKVKSLGNIAAWKEGRVQFRDKSFGEIANDLNIQYNIKIHFDNMESYATKFTGSFDPNTPFDEILEVLKMTKNFNYRQLPNGDWLIE